jgi:integrase
VEYIPIERSADAFQQPVGQSHIIALCQRAFGEEKQIESAKELGGGLYNTTYLVHISGISEVAQALTAEQALHLLRVSRGHILEALITLALVTALRHGELMALHWRDVNLEEKRF